MCYGSGCWFENHMGDCQVHMDYIKFKEKYGFSACAVGRSLRDEEDKGFYEEHEQELDAARKQYYKDQEDSFRRFWDEMRK